MSQMRVKGNTEVPCQGQPHALRTKIVDKLHEMESDHHIVKVTEQSDRESSMVTVVKNGKDLNRARCHEHYPIPTVEEVASMSGAQIFSVIGAKSGFLHIELDYESSLLTTFNRLL